MLLYDFAQEYCFVTFSRCKHRIVNIKRRKTLIDHPAKRLNASPVQVTLQLSCLMDRRGLW